MVVPWCFLHLFQVSLIVRHLFFWHSSWSHHSPFHSLKGCYTIIIPSFSHICLGIFHPIILHVTISFKFTRWIFQVVVWHPNPWAPLSAPPCAAARWSCYCWAPPVPSLCCAPARSRRKKLVMWVNQCRKPPILEWFIPPIYGDFWDGLLLF